MLDFRRRCVKKSSSRALSAFHPASFAAYDHRAWIDGVAILLHLDYFAFLVNQICHASRGFVTGVVDTILFAGIAAEIAEQGECHSNLRCPCFVGEWTVHAYTQDLGVCAFQFLQLILEGLHLFLSTAGESKDVKREHDIFLAAEVGELYFLSVLVTQLEIGRGVAYFDFRVGSGRLIGGVCRRQSCEEESGKKAEDWFTHQVLLVFAIWKRCMLQGCPN